MASPLDQWRFIAVGSRLSGAYNLTVGRNRHLLCCSRRYPNTEVGPDWRGYLDRAVNVRFERETSAKLELY
jgi:hypothetical protein